VAGAHMLEGELLVPGLTGVVAQAFCSTGPAGTLELIVQVQVRPVSFDLTSHPTLQTLLLWSPWCWICIATACYL
jgi:hypothetical protein